MTTMNDQEREIDVMRYVDGEMDAAEHSAFEGRMAADDALRAAVERERALRQLLQGTYAPVVEEPVPARLMAALATRRVESHDRAQDLAQDPAQDQAHEEVPVVVSLDAARARRRVMPTWAALGGMAASVVLGVMIGHRLLMPVQDASNGLVAQGELEEVLSTKLSGEQAGTARAGLSFHAKGGGFCRSFSTGDSAGVACHETAGWRVRQLAPLGKQAVDAAQYRTAASEMPPAVLQAVDDLREGDVFDAKQEAEAKAKGWR